jgi:hypothetical protein
MKFSENGNREPIHNTSIALKLKNGSNKLEWLLVASDSSLLLCNTVAYWPHSKVTKKMKFCENGNRECIYNTSIAL